MNRNIVGLLILYLFLLLLSGACSPEVSKTLSSDSIDDAIKRSARYLVKATQKNGMFVYRVNMDPTINVKKKYNIVRHAGAIYAMVMVYERYPEEKMRSAIERAGQYLRDESILPVPERPDMLAIWSKPEVNGSGGLLQAKLGGTGLGLVALLSIEKISPGFTPLSDLRALGQFIVYMQKQDGSFCSKYIPSKGGRQDNWQSLYYPGEAALGLVMLYEKDADSIWLKSAYNALGYLARTRKNNMDIPADHWTLLATERILSIEPNREVSISRSLLIHHAIQICETMLRDQVYASTQPKYNGGFTMDGRTTPAAIRLEGLLAALSFLPKDQDVVKRLSSSIDAGIFFLVQAQIRSGDFSGAIPRAVVKLQGDSYEVKKFNNRTTEVRIDYVQHSLSAFVQYQQMLK